MNRLVESLYCTHETNITLYVNYTGIEINNFKKRSRALQWIYDLNYLTPSYFLSENWPGAY